MTGQGLCIFSSGMGQDSQAIALKLINDPWFREEYVGGRRLIVVHAATGDEHEETNKHTIEMAELFAKHGIEFHHITPELGYHSENWLTLRTQYNNNRSCGSKAYPKTCTWNLKLRPIYWWLEDWLAEQYGLNAGRKKSLYEFNEYFGPIRVILGIAAGEDKRAGKDRSKEPKWMQRTIEKVYPLIDLGMDRQGCQDYIQSTGHQVTVPSNCMLCPFMDKRELLLLARDHPGDYQDWVRIEQNKIQEYEGRGTPADKNFGVWGRKLLPQVLEEAEAEYGHMTVQQLREHRFSHGHCVASTY